MINKLLARFLAVGFLAVGLEVLAFAPAHPPLIYIIAVSIQLGTGAALWILSFFIWD